MKKRLSIAGSVMAIAMAMPGQAQAEDAPFDGLYVGAAAGGAFQGNDSDSTVLFDRNLDGTFGDTVTTVGGANAFAPGFCGGAALTGAVAGGCRDDEDGFDISGRIGYDRQFGSLVIGAVAEFGRSDINDSVTAFSGTPASYVLSRAIDYNGRLGVRGGFATGRTLFYATGGASIARLNNSFATTNVVNAFADNGDSTAFGFNAGGGIEHRIFSNLSIGVEYLYTDLKDDDYRLRVGPAAGTVSTNPFILGNPNGTDFARSDDRFRYQAVRATVAYRF
jgi:outer membrane immunogenic protein